jgi:hypothetical protein
MLILPGKISGVLCSIYALACILSIQVAMLLERWSANLRGRPYNRLRDELLLEDLTQLLIGGNPHRELNGLEFQLMLDGFEQPTRIAEALPIRLGEIEEGRQAEA